MADAAWKKLKDKVTAKRGKKRDARDTAHELLKGNELTVQFNGYLQRYREKPKKYAVNSQ